MLGGSATTVAHRFRRTDLRFHQFRQIHLQPVLFAGLQSAALSLPVGW